MKFVKTVLQDKVCFIPDEIASQLSYPCFSEDIEYSDDVLCDFLNLYKQDFKLDSTFGEVETFARKHGSLMNEDWLTSITVPKGFSCIELQNFETKFEVQKIYYEELSEWKKHILAFNDLCHIAYVKAHTTRLDYYNVVRYLLQNLIYYKESDGTCSYVYFGSSAFLDGDNSHITHYLPPEVREYINLVGNVFIYYAKTEAQFDSLENRQNWFRSHVNTIFRNYQEQYIEKCKVSDVNLLGKMQDSLIYWINQKRPLNLCLSCGSFFFPSSKSVQTSRLCSSLCQSRFYKSRDVYQMGFTASTAFSDADFNRMFTPKRKKE